MYLYINITIIYLFIINSILKHFMTKNFVNFEYKINITSYLRNFLNKIYSWLKNTILMLKLLFVLF